MHEVLVVAEVEGRASMEHMIDFIFRVRCLSVGAPGGQDIHPGTERGNPEELAVSTPRDELFGLDPFHVERFPHGHVARTALPG